MEGKEIRKARFRRDLGSDDDRHLHGSVNRMHDSLNLIAGMIAMSNLMLNVVFSGVARAS